MDDFVCESDTKQSMESKGKEKQPLLNICGVCDYPASDVFHYGAIVCFSCRAFFRRSIKGQAHYRSCLFKTNNCIGTKKNKRKCKKCRLEKCLEVGMKPDKIDRVKNKKSNGKVTAETDGRFQEIDISDLAEECFHEEYNKLDEENLSTSLPISPGFELTLEEEFKIHELMVRKENLDDDIFQLYIKVASFQSFKNYLMSICHGRFEQGGRWNCFENYEQDVLYNVRHLNGIPILSSTSMFDGFTNLSENMKYEMLEFTMPLRTMVIRAQISENQEKKFFLDQRAAAGILTKSLDEAYNKVFPNNRFAVISIDPLGAFSKFTSPWATRQNDEKFFIDTLKAIGGTLKDDMNLGILYSLLVFSTPGHNLSDQTKVS